MQFLISWRSATILASFIFLFVVPSSAFTAIKVSGKAGEVQVTPFHGALFGDNQRLLETNAWMVTTACSVFKYVGLDRLDGKTNTTLCPQSKFSNTTTLNFYSESASVSGLASPGYFIPHPDWLVQDEEQQINPIALVLLNGNFSSLVKEGKVPTLKYARDSSKLPSNLVARSFKEKSWESISLSVSKNESPFEQTFEVTFQGNDSLCTNDMTGMPIYEGDESLVALVLRCKEGEKKIAVALRLALFIGWLENRVQTDQRPFSYQPTDAQHSGIWSLSFISTAMVVLVGCIMAVYLCMRRRRKAYAVLSSKDVPMGPITNENEI